MHKTVDEAKRNLRKLPTKGRQSLAERLRWHQPTMNFMQCLLFLLPIGKRCFGETSPTS
ncbi:MAG: hypothetical protein LBU34_01490 [Planctomycetaceae bacterium]|nr:hypothetical protein [Planctomycetaceae bacterium]